MPVFPFLDPSAPVQQPTPIPVTLLPLRRRTLPWRPSILVRFLLLTHIPQPQIFNLLHTHTPRISANSSRHIHTLGRGWVARRPWV